MKRKKKVEDNSKKEIWHSVFEPQYIASVVQTGTVGALVFYSLPLRCHNLRTQVKTLDHKSPMTAADFET